MRRRLTGCVAGLVVLVLGAAAVPVVAADNGTVGARVIAGGIACVTVGNDVDFGTAQFQALGTTTVTVGTPAVTVTSCSGGSQTILAKGTDATGTGAGATWTLATAAQCGPQGTPNLYNLGLRLAGGGDTYLALANTSLGTLGANGTLTRTPLLRMPCTGSSGGGQTMSMSYVLTATIP